MRAAVWWYVSVLLPSFRSPSLALVLEPRRTTLLIIFMIYLLAVDVWSAGIILLFFLTHKFPVFQANDDIEALMEIAAIFGKLKMEKVATLHCEFICPRSRSRSHSCSRSPHLPFPNHPIIHSLIKTSSMTTNDDLQAGPLLPTSQISARST